jgi:hypothetical protein
MSGRRWHSWGATSPLWGSGLVLIMLGFALVATAVRTVRRGPR